MARHKSLSTELPSMTYMQTPNLGFGIPEVIAKRASAYSKWISQGYIFETNIGGRGCGKEDTSLKNISKIYHSIGDIQVIDMAWAPGKVEPEGHMRAILIKPFALANSENKNGTLEAQLQTSK